MKLQIALIALLLTVAACGGDKAAAKPDAKPAEAAKPAASLDGTYKMSHTVGVIDEGDEGTQVEDCLFVEASGADLKFELGVVGEADHRCSMNGVAKAAGENVWSHVEDMDGTRCELKITLFEDRFEVVDVEETCREQFCGARASIGTTLFARNMQTPGDTCQP